MFARPTPTVFTALFALAFALLATTASADSASKSFPLNGFSAIELKGGSNLEVAQGDHFAVVVRGERDALQYAKAEVRGDTLELSVDMDSKSLFGVITVSSEPELDFQVTLPTIHSLEVTGSGDARSAMLESEALELRVTGSGLIRLEKVAAESLNTSVTGSGDLILGTVLAVRSSAGITGSGDLRLDKFAGEQLDVRIKGSGDMQVGGKVSNLSVNIMGSGDFVGSSLSAKNASGRIMGSGDIVLRRPVNQSFSVMGSGDVALVE
ncbi:GIN domain-containing protein [Microbulbifer celer]|uniref:GIN domain-containing protein n=1 Tax=Microbulbifer celer TaxID=435905 RepID=A0ABW3UAW7_9GAMM|nr:DUF2807 domain-containing protein [Microbulbifer celer]UFN59073.1 DUF2807 domain-containing protein [Microbulbifer celer]